MSSAARLQAVSGHLASYPKGLIAGDVVIVTGAAQGIGKACALLFAREGAKVIVSDIDGAKAQAVVKEISSLGGDAFTIAGDITAEAFPKDLIEGTLKKYGKVSHIVNNAGFTFDKMLHTMSDDAFELILKVHNVAPFRIIKAAAGHLRSKDPKVVKQNRSIVNVSSIAGLHGNVGQANYATAKAGICGLTKTVAKEWGAFNVRCNTVAFGLIETRLTQPKENGDAMIVNGQKIALGIPGGGSKPGEPVPGIPLGRGAKAEEAASAVLFLISPMASYITGHTLEVTGGTGI